MVPYLMPKYLSHFERVIFVVVYFVRVCSNFISLHVAVQISQHHLLRRLSFSHCMFSSPLSKVNCPQIHVFISGSLFCYTELCVCFCAMPCCLGPSQVVLLVKKLPIDAGTERDVNLILGSGGSPGGRNGNPLQYSCLENPMDRGACWAMVHRVLCNCTFQNLVLLIHCSLLQKYLCVQV